MRNPHGSPPPTEERRAPVVGGPASLGAVGVASGAALVVAITAESRVLALLALAIPAVLVGMSRPRLLRRMLLVVVAFEIPIQIDTFVGHDPREALWASLSGFNVSLTSVALVGLVWLWTLDKGSGATRGSRIPRRILVPAVLYASVVILSMLVATDVRMSLYYVVVIVQALLVLLTLAFSVRDRDDVVLVMLAIAAAVIVQGLLAVYLTLGPSSVDLGFIRASREGQRVGGTFLSPNVLGGVLVLLLPLTLALAVAGPQPIMRIAGGVAWAFGLLALVLTFSRGAWIGAAVGFTIALWIALRRRWVNARFVVFAATLLLVVAAATGPDIVSRLSVFDNAAARSRLPLMELAWDMIRDRPFLGVGTNNFATALPQFLTVDYARAWISTVHNKYLLVWAETGVVGLVAFLWLLWATIRTAMHSTRVHDATLAAVSAGLAAGLAGHMVHMLVDIFNKRVNVHSLWLVIGLVTVVSVAPPVARRPRIARGQRVPPSVR